MMSAKENRNSKVPEPAAAGAEAGRESQAEQPLGDTAPGTPPSTPDQIEELKAKAAKADEHWDRLVRTTADLENFKKRAARERQEAIRFANAALLEKLIPALDNFDMALAAASNTEGNSLESLKTGLTMVYNQLKAVLTEAGLEEIDASGRPFDPNLHEAVSQQETADVPEGQVLRQLRKGYKLRDRLIRPASVVVAKTPAV